MHRDISISSFSLSSGIICSKIINYPRIILNITEIAKDYARTIFIITEIAKDCARIIFIITEIAKDYPMTKNCPRTTRPSSPICSRVPSLSPHDK